MKPEKSKQLNGLTPEQIEDLFAARLAKIFVDQILDKENKEETNYGSEKNV